MSVSKASQHRMTKSDGPRPLDAGTAEVRLALDAVAGQLTTLWSSALERDDFDEITRLVEAGRAVRRAALALSTDSLVTLSSSSSSSSPDRSGSRPAVPTPETAA